MSLEGGILFPESTDGCVVILRRRAQDGGMFANLTGWHLIIILLSIAALVLFIAAIISIIRAPRASSAGDRKSVV